MVAVLLLFVRAVVAVLVLGRWWRGEGPDRSGVVHWVPTPSLYGCRRPMGVAWRPRRGFGMPLCPFWGLREYLKATRCTVVVVAVVLVGVVVEPIFA